jgi:hypothetical protein
MKVAPVIGVGTVMPRRPRTGIGAVRGLSLPRSRRVLPRGSRELSVARGAILLRSDGR